MKILMSAYACNPEKGSEDAIGWNWAKQAARFHDVWVLTRGENREAIEAELARHPEQRLNFFFYDIPAWLTKFPLGERQVYLAWQISVLATARALNKRVKFDIGHHITFGGVRYPTFLTHLGIPFILGPIGGSERGPRSFYPSFGLKGAVWELMRDLTGVTIGMNPLVRASLRQATYILVTSEQTLKSIPQWAQRKTSVMAAVGISTPLGSDLQHLPRDSKRFGVLYAGRLVPWKGVRFVVEAFAKFQRDFQSSKLTIAGAGPDLRFLERIAAREGISEHVDFKGEVPFSMMSELYETHDVFLFPCFHLSGIAVLEAMSMGLPVVTLDIGDSSESVTDSTGIRVSAHSPRQLVNDLSLALRRLADDRTLTHQMSQEARRRVADIYDWERKGEVLEVLYASVTADPAPVRTAAEP